MKISTKVTMLFLALFMTSLSFAQDKKPASPPAAAKGTINGANITINYSSPFVKGREIWGGLVPYGQIWRAGANAPTTFEIDKALKIEGHELPAGKYAFYVIPEKDHAIVIFGKDPSVGAHKFDQTNEQLRFTVKTRKSKQMNESLVYNIDKNKIVLSWENVDIPMEVRN